jgi:hypothetical protein
VLKLRVRKWICREVSCSQRIFAERFPEVAQRYARMTDRLIKALQSLGVTTNGADAARIASSLGMPTTAKTIIRRVLQLALPSEDEVAKVGIDEWGATRSRMCSRKNSRKEDLTWSSASSALPG